MDNTQYQYEPVARVEKVPAPTRVHYEAIENDMTVNINTSSKMVVSSSSSPSRRFLYIAACTGNLASFICGTAFGWTSPEIPKLKSLQDTPLDHALTISEEGWIGSFLPLAAVIGPFAAGVMADNIGRKRTLLISALPFLIAFTLNVFATNVYYFFLSRFLCGLGVGTIFTVLPMYIGEISDDEVRGSLGSFMQLFIVTGLLFSYSLGPYIPMQLFNITLIVPPGIFFAIFLMCIPESPFYLVKVNKSEAAQKALTLLRGTPPSAVQKELEVIKSEVDYLQNNKGSFFDIFKSSGLTKALFLSVGLVSLQQLSGINIILFYTQNVFTDAGVSLAPEICVIIIGAVQIAASAATPVLVEKWGKRFLLVLSAVGMCISQGVMAYFFYLKDDKLIDVSSIGWIPIVSLNVYIITYCLGFGPLPWAIMGELFPANVKTIASSITASVCWILGFLLTKYFGTVASLIGKSGSFGFFAVCCFIAAIFIFKCLPETSGKSLQEIQDILNGVAK